MILHRVCGHCKQEITLDTSMREKQMDWRVGDDRHCPDQPVQDPDDGRFRHEDSIVVEIREYSRRLREEYSRDHPPTDFVKQLRRKKRR